MELRLMCVDVMVWQASLVSSSCGRCTGRQGDSEGAEGGEQVGGRGGVEEEPDGGADGGGLAAAETANGPRNG